MFGPIGGIVPGMFPVGAGQLLLATRKDRLTWRRWRKIRHAGVVVSASENLPPGTIRHRESGTYFPPDEQGDRPWRDVPMGQYDTYETGVITAPLLVQAMPRGAEEIEMRQQKHWTPDHVYIRPEYSDCQNVVVADWAREYVGTPYNFLTYAALALHAFDPVWRIAPEAATRVLAGYIRDQGNMMCSQLVDQCLTDAGFHVFEDGRLPQDVVPAELFRTLLVMPGTTYALPGRSTAWTDGMSYFNRI